MQWHLQWVKFSNCCPLRLFVVMLVIELEEEGSGGEDYSGCMTFVFIILAILPLNQSLTYFSLLYLSRYVPVVKADRRPQSRGSQTKGPGLTTWPEHEFLRSLWTKCWMPCPHKSLSHFRAWKEIKLFLESL